VGAARAATAEATVGAARAATAAVTEVVVVATAAAAVTPEAGGTDGVGWPQATKLSQLSCYCFDPCYHESPRLVSRVTVRFRFCPLMLSPFALDQLLNEIKSKVFVRISFLWSSGTRM
jgi:hypothetical protein